MVLVVRNHLLEVPVQLGGELLVPEGAALLVKDFVDGGDQLQLLLSVGLGEAVDTEGVQHHRGTLELLVSQVPGNWRVFFSSSLYYNITYMAATKRKAWRATVATMSRFLAWASTTWLN